MFNPQPRHEAGELKVFIPAKDTDEQRIINITKNPGPSNGKSSEKSFNSNNYDQDFKSKHSTPISIAELSDEDKEA